MATLKEIRRRIGSVKNTQKITKAMKLVSAAKFARASTAIRGAQSYGQVIDHLLQQVSQNIDLDDLEIFKMRPEQKILLIVLTSDRGLCGALNTNILKASNRFLKEKIEAGTAVDLILIGKKCAQYYTRIAKGDVVKNILKSSGAPIGVVGSHQSVLERPEFSFADGLAKGFCKQFADVYDGVYAVYPEFRSALSQTPLVERILPITAKAATGKDTTLKLAEQNIDYLVKPDKATVVQELVTRQISNKVFRIMLNASASEHGARMTAMDSATNNAREVIKKLTLAYNRGRQAAITTELIEITSGASAL